MARQFEFASPHVITQGYGAGDADNYRRKVIHFQHCGLNSTGSLFGPTRESQLHLESEIIFPAPPQRAGG